MTVAPPRPKSLPLTALRAFEAAARLGGFAAAAEELHVSSGAISAHIKTIESELGAALFERSARGVRLTPLGQRALPHFAEAFDGLGEAVQRLRTDAAPGVVHISALPAIAQFWLSPRLPALRAAAPEIQISITALEHPPNLKRVPYDLCLFHSETGGETVAQDALLPVCAPALADRMRHPGDMAEMPCLTDTGWPDDWRTWIRAALPDAGFTPRGPLFSLYSLAVEETINGAGILMGHTALVSSHLASGKLVAPFDMPVPLSSSLRMWSLRPASAKSPAGRVAGWLRSMGADHP
ncbi:LysR family transcriptional regulator [Sedimentitalea sp. XS_ASV28]|uniref:LysR family transcriptional regulator n=1 Tax=Sedimentitalea sp. XS_ASV28 TaxID=3241296 RepID=UPI00351884D4